MNANSLAILAVGCAYLIGAIPFAYLIVLAVKGVDIRTVGSGNVGATNAGRLLGFHFFLIVFALDLLKGLLPTLLLPGLVARVGGAEVDGLAVFVALATILGHNFPIYLRFRGGKGVATSLGAMFAINAVAGVAATLAFGASFLATRIVSISSVLGGIAYAATYFARAWGHAWDGPHRATSLLILGLLGMLIVRHKNNFARIASGTESKVDLRLRKRPPAGCTRWFVLSGILALGSVGAAAAVAMRPSRLDCGAFVLETVTRAETGHQRAGRLEFADGGRLLAVCCPRYNRVVLYRVTPGESLELVRDIPLEGRPVAVRPNGDRLYVLQRPTADARHVEAGWWETFDFRGRPVGERFRVGFDPDDLAFAPHGRTAYVLLSGRAEGESNRPAPELLALDLGDGSGSPVPAGRIAFDRPGDDPERIHLASNGKAASVTLAGSNQIAHIDLADPARPALGERTPWTSEGKDDRAPSAPGTEAVRLEGTPACLISLRPGDSALSVRIGLDDPWTGKLPLRGTANLGGIRPAGLACSEERGLIAVSNRQGGSVHLIAIRPRPASPRFQPGPAGG